MGIAAQAVKANQYKGGGGMITSFNISDTGSFSLVDQTGSNDHRKGISKLLAGLDRVHLDPVALSEFPSRYSFVGDRTLFAEIKRTNWFHSLGPEALDGRSVLPSHGTRLKRPREIAVALYELLLEEVSSYVSGKDHVGILLSGGMDSRIVAGVLKRLQASKAFEVTVFCWGGGDTRDPVYAKRIASQYDWAFQHFEVNAKTLSRNIQLCAEQGCFYSAQHLHAMESVAISAKELGVGCMLAGSYGDSIGRAEYHSIHASKLKPIKQSLRNWFNLFSSDFYSACIGETYDTIDAYHRQYGSSNPAVLAELDQQLHYMRNRLGTGMDVIAQQVPLKQVFTSKAVVGYMWGLDYACRGDETYAELLKLIDSSLLDIPWARTGKLYGRNDLPADDIKKDFHRYNFWTRFDLQDEICESIFSGEIERLDVFNWKVVSLMVNTFYGNPYAAAGRFLECILWLASLGHLLRELGPKLSLGNLHSGRSSAVSTMVGSGEVYLYNMRQMHLARRREMNESR